MADERIVGSEVYDAGGHRLHYQHAAEAYDFAERADDMQRFADRSDGDKRMRYVRLAESCERRAQWHATMALYEALAPRSGT